MTNQLAFTGAFKLSKDNKRCLMKKLNGIIVDDNIVRCERLRDMETQVYTYEDNNSNEFYDVGIAVNGLDNVSLGFNYLRMPAEVFKAVLNRNVKFRVNKDWTVDIEDIGLAVLNEI